MGDEGDKISKKNWRGDSRDSFFLKILSPSEPILRAKIENMISSDYVLCWFWFCNILFGHEQKYDGIATIIWMLRIGSMAKKGLDKLHSNLITQSCKCKSITKTLCSPPQKYLDILNEVKCFLGTAKKWIFLFKNNRIPTVNILQIGASVINWENLCWWKNNFFS